MKNSSKGGLVYSTAVGRICPECRLALAACVCKARAKAAPVGDGMVRVSRQTKGRGGKSVTIIKGLALDSLALALLGKQLRTACGSGGTVKDGVIEVRATIANWSWKRLESTVIARSGLVAKPLTPEHR